MNDFRRKRGLMYQSFVQPQENICVQVLRTHLSRNIELNIEQWAGGNETSNLEAEVGGTSPVTNARKKRNRRMSEWIEGAGRGQWSRGRAAFWRCQSHQNRVEEGPEHLNESVTRLFVGNKNFIQWRLSFHVSKFSFNGDCRSMFQNFLEFSKGNNVQLFDRIYFMTFHITTIPRHWKSSVHAQWNPATDSHSSRALRTISWTFPS
jgi:hypothetical protein